MSNDQFDQINQLDQIGQTAAFIRLAEPPAFDINRHLQNIRSQLPADQLENLEKRPSNRTPASLVTFPK